LNVFIAIIEEAYVSIRMTHKNSLVYTYLKLEPDFIDFKDDSDDVNDEYKPLPGDLNRQESRKLGTTLLPEQINKYDSEQKRIKQSIYSKNTLREALNIDYKKLLNKNPREKTKIEVDNILKEHFQNVYLFILSLNLINTIYINTY